MSSWEAQRIARTEVHNAHNKAIQDTYKDMGVEYTQWIAAGDDRTRDSHVEIDGEIILVGETYSNGLRYPGDTSGPLEEWINCRCSHAPFVVPVGYEAPSFSPFRESDLVRVELPSVEEVLGHGEPMEQSLSEPKDLNSNIILSKEQVDSLTFAELAEHHGAKYEGVKTYDYDGKKYHTFTQSFENGETLTIKFEEGAVKSYTKKGWVSPNEIINEVFKTPLALKRQTDEIWFKNTNNGIEHRPYTKSKYDSLNPRVGGYNLSKPWYRLEQWQKKDPQHRIVINPKYFKGSSGRTGFIWEPQPDNARNWKMTIQHEFTHSIDNSREYYAGKQWRREWVELSCSKEYLEILEVEPDFTWYANTEASENLAEHGGYVARMLNNPSEQNMKVEISIHNEKGGITKKDITFKEYKEIYPLHYEYFTKLFKEVVPRY